MVHGGPWVGAWPKLAGRRHVAPKLVAATPKRGVPVVLTEVFGGRGDDEEAPATGKNKQQRYNSARGRLGCGGVKSEVGLDAVEGGGAHGAFYRPGQSKGAAFIGFNGQWFQSLKGRENEVTVATIQKRELKEGHDGQCGADQQ
jgi:hypothetical protein